VPHEHKPHRFPPERRHLLNDEERLRRMPPEPLLVAAGIRAGQTVVDVGAGTGFWTGPLSTLVGPTGRVLAVDVEPVMHDELRTLIKTRDLTNVEVVPSEEDSIPLGDAMADAAVLGFVLHEPADPSAFLHEICRVLRPAAHVLVADWQKKPTDVGPPLEHRLAEDEVVAMLEGETFEVERLEVPNSDVYVLVGVRRETAGD
jgi:ubiquinone/menaquinone biosynthesis C-methylase UbiE